MPDNRDYRRRVYEKYASRIQQAAPRFDAEAARRAAKSTVHYLRGWLPGRKDAAIVDLGCGGGRLLFAFKELGYTNLEGIDISAEQVELARQATPNVREGDVLEFLKDRRGSFDLITATDIIEHLDKAEVLEFLDGCARALAPGGRLVLQTPNAESPMGGAVRYKDFTHEVCFSPEGLARLLRLCGFERIEPRETGPRPWGYSAASTVRAIVWGALRRLIMLYNLAETGSRGSGVFTRTFLISGVKPRSPES